MVKSPRREVLLKVNLLRVVFEVISAIVNPVSGRYRRGRAGLSRSNNSGVYNIGSCRHNKIKGEHCNKTYEDCWDVYSFMFVKTF
jgi:hypothetical protein